MRLVCVLDTALHDELIGAAELAAAVAARRGRAGAARLRAAARLADGRSESPAETLARLLLLPVLPDLEPQFRLREGGFVIARSTWPMKPASSTSRPTASEGTAGATWCEGP